LVAGLLGCHSGRLDLGEQFVGGIAVALGGGELLGEGGALGLSRAQLPCERVARGLGRGEPIGYFGSARDRGFSLGFGRRELLGGRGGALGRLELGGAFGRGFACRDGEGNLRGELLAGARGGLGLRRGQLLGESVGALAIGFGGRQLFGERFALFLDRGGALLGFAAGRLRRGQLFLLQGPPRLRRRPRRRNRARCAGRRSDRARLS